MYICIKRNELPEWWTLLTPATGKVIPVYHVTAECNTVTREWIRIPEGHRISNVYVDGCFGTSSLVVTKDGKDNIYALSEANRFFIFSVINEEGEVASYGVTKS